MSKQGDQKEHDAAASGATPGGASRPDLSLLRRVTPPPSLVAGVMRRIAEPPAPSFWRWVRRPFVIELRFSPLGMSLAGVGVAFALALLVGQRDRPEASASTIAVSGPRDSSGAESPGRAGGAAQTPVLVRFVLEAKGARHVSLAGSFNDWNRDGTVLEPIDGSGRFAATVALPPGLHEYMFIVDGQWVTDPAARERRPDGFGRQNSLLRL